MYCKKCGKPLHKGDRFCSGCGAKVEEEFVPAFKQTEQAASESREKKPRKSFTTPDFNWDLDGYPTDHKKTEEVDFNWDSVLEEKQRILFEEQRRREEPQETLLKGAAQAESSEQLYSSDLDTAGMDPAGTVSSGKDSVSDVEELEKAIFADMGTLDRDDSGAFASAGEDGTERIDKFYTFNKKNEEFQALLDREYERIRRGRADGEEPSGESEFDRMPPAKSSVRHEEFDWTLPGDRRTAEPAAASAEPLSYVGVVLSSVPRGYLAPDPAEPATESKENTAAAEQEKKIPATGAVKKEEEPSGAEPFQKNGNPEKEGADQDKQRLTFNDVFDDDDDSKKPEKKGTALKVIAVILCILLAAEGVMIGIQKFAPESAAAQTINKIYSRIFSLFGKDGEPDEPADSAEGDSEQDGSEIAGFIETSKKLGKNIAAVEEDDSLTFEEGENYGFEDFSDTYAFSNKPWYTDDEGNSVTYGQEIVSTTIQFYSAWVDKMNGKNDRLLEFTDETSELYTELEGLEGENDVLYGIDVLRIGEIRAGSAGFYVYTAVTKADSSTSKSVTERQILYMEPVSKAMKIVDIKEI